MTTDKRKTIATEAKMPLCNASIFFNLENTIGFCRRCVKMEMAMQVEDEYWVVSPAEAQRLNRLGYQYVQVM